MQMLTMKGASKKHRGVAQVQGASKKGRRGGGPGGEDVEKKRHPKWRRHLMVVILSQQPVGNSAKIYGRTGFTCFSPPKKQSVELYQNRNPINSI